MSDRVDAGSLDADAGSGRWARGRRAPGLVLRLIMRDPHHVPERVLVYAVDRQADAARAWARDAVGSPAALADEQRRRTIGAARIDGAIAGTPFFIALVPAYIAFLWQEVRLHLRVAALFGHDPADPRVAAEFLVLRGVRADAGAALADLEAVRATPLPAAGARTPLRSWYTAIVAVLVLAGFLGPPEEDPGVAPTRRQQALRVVRIVMAGLIWALTWVVPITFMIVMSWGCESDARRFGGRVVAHYGAEAGVPEPEPAGNRAITFVRAAVVFLSVAIPLGFVAATVLNGKGPLGVDVPESAGALVALALVIGVAVAAIRA